MIKKIIFVIFLILFAGNLNAEVKTYQMVFVPASEKGDESDYTSLIAIIEKLTGFNINTIKVTDYNAAVEAMRAGRAHIAWYGGKTYVKNDYSLATVDIVQDPSAPSAFVDGIMEGKEWIWENGILKPQQIEEYETEIKKVPMGRISEAQERIFSDFLSKL